MHSKNSSLENYYAVKVILLLFFLAEFLGIFFIRMTKGQFSHLSSAAAGRLAAPGLRYV